MAINPLTYPPRREPVALVEAGNNVVWPGALTRLWDVFFRQVIAALEVAPGQVAIVDLADQAAAIGATAIGSPTLAAGLYRVTFRLIVTRAAGTSSDVELKLRSTDRGGGVAQTIGALSLNSTTEQISGVRLMAADNGTSVTYEVRYVSVGAPTMQYALDIQMEALPG